MTNRNKWPDMTGDLLEDFQSYEMFNVRTRK